MSRFAAALMALALLSYASVQSIVMQAAMTSPALRSADAPSGRDGPTATARPSLAQPAMSQMDMPPMVMATLGLAGAHETHSVSTRQQPAHDVVKHHAACPFCSAAAHLPILASGVPIRVSQVVAFAAFRLVASHGPRGPPPPQPRARGPPDNPLTL